jgi:branched-chain amino acid transport system permease protein
VTTPSGPDPRQPEPTPADDGSSSGGVTTTPEVTGAPGPGAPAPGAEPRPFLQKTLVRHGLLHAGALLGIVLLLEAISPFRNAQLAQMAYFVPAVAGLTVLTGINGQISLGHGALMMVGAYTTAYTLENAEGTPFVVVLLLAIVTTTIVGAVVGVAAARLHGPYLAGATLALAVGLPGIALKFEDALGGEQGLRVSPPRPTDGFESFYAGIFGDLSNQKFIALVGWALAIAVLFLLSNLITSRVGRDWRAVRDDEVAAQLAGINIGRSRVLAFTVSAACAGVAGCMLAAVTRLAAPGSFTIVLSISLLAAIVIGGLGSLVGAILGSAMLVFLPQVVTDFGAGQGLNSSQAANIAPLVYGIVLVVVMLVAPFGLVGTIRRKYLERKARKMLEAFAAAQSQQQG